MRGGYVVGVALAAFALTACPPPSLSGIDADVIDETPCTEAGTARCMSSCVPVDIDPMNCGNCGVVCPGGANAAPACVAGHCVLACNTGFGDCDQDPSNGCEVDLTSDPHHCGSCASVCPMAANTVPVCTNSQCTTRCATNYSDCDHLASNGCEATLASPMNCGACGTVCPSSTPFCSMNAAGAFSCTSGCMSGTMLCGGTCSNVQTDPANCGSCGNACPMGANATPTCAGGVCGTQCAMGFGDCNVNPADGCESDFSSNPQHCGNCTTACPPAPNASPSCASGTCSFTCNPGYANCDFSTSNGCECPPVPNGSGSCILRFRLCSYSCNTGFADCNANSSDGCEVNTQTNNLNCGSCGNVCAAGTYCCNGGCINTLLRCLRF